MSKQNIYDNDLFVRKLRENTLCKEINFNDIIETPIISGMIPELYKKKVLDIGCGMEATCTSIFKDKGRYPFLELIYRKKC